MRTVLVNGKGDIFVEHVKIPKLIENGVLCKNRFSLISSGTETSLILNKREKGSEEPKFPLGYCAAGVVDTVGKECKDIGLGERIACGGWTIAVHGDMVSVPRNLLAKVPEGVSLREASFTTLACIALHGVRRSQVGIGDTVVMIGQGIIGQMCAQFAHIVGAKVVVSGHRDFRLKISKKLAADLAINANKDDPVRNVMEFTQNEGADAVIICSGGNNSDAFSQAVQMARDRAKIILVGNSTIPYDDQVFYQNFYRKELSLLSSRSYGPGRYDPKYEQEGHDYPAGYVKWTENRNMQEILRLMNQGLLKVSPLITDEFPLQRAPEAYQEIMEHPDTVLGVILRYEDVE